MKFDILASNVQKKVSDGLPEILVGAAIFGVVLTSYEAAKATMRANKHLDLLRHEDEADVAIFDIIEPKEAFRACWRFYVPTMLYGSGTITLMILSNRVSSSRVSAATAAYAMVDRAYSEYKEHVAGEIGEKREEKIRAAISEKHVAENPPGASMLIAAGDNTLCLEEYTGRYFVCDMEKLKTALNTINYKINHEFYVTLDEFYDLVGLASTTESSNLGWDSDKQLDLQFTPVLDKSGKPVLGFSYNYVKPLK